MSTTRHILLVLLPSLEKGYPNVLNPTYQDVKNPPTPVDRIKPPIGQAFALTEEPPSEISVGQSTELDHDLDMRLFRECRTRM